MMQALDGDLCFHTQVNTHAGTHTHIYKKDEPFGEYVLSELYNTGVTCGS